MKFKTRLYITFITIILLPLALSAIAFFFIGYYLVNQNNLVEGSQIDFETAFLNIETISQMISEELEEQAKLDTKVLEDEEYLAQINSIVDGYNSYIIVLKNNEPYYVGNHEVAKFIIDRLPKYGKTMSDDSVRYFYPDLKKYVTQIDFIFSDGDKGSLYVITKQAELISKTLIIDMAIAIILILLFTSIMLTRWIHKGVFDPVNKLNYAMKSIKEGNLEYRLENNQQGEIGELYSNYEEMRLQLKESMEENKINVLQNKELISNISHDLKTPITAIKGYMEGIIDGVADTPQKIDKYVRTVYHKANDMDKLINELTTYSGIDNNRVTYNFRCINVGEYFGDCVEEVGLDLEAKNIQLKYTNLVDDETRIIADPEQLKKVINNIISNSVKYKNKDKGIIKIRLFEDADAVSVEIKDNGKGIEAKNLSNIFERFYRTDTSRNSAQGGSGIGLSIVKKIVEDHGGYVYATSKENEFTCIHFVIRKYKEL